MLVKKNRSTEVNRNGEEKSSTTKSERLVNPSRLDDVEVAGDVAVLYGI